MHFGVGVVFGDRLGRRGGLIGGKHWDCVYGGK